jgi:hypothetical protein
MFVTGEKRRFVSCFPGFLSTRCLARTVPYRSVPLLMSLSADVEALEGSIFDKKVCGNSSAAVYGCVIVSPGRWSPDKRYLGRAEIDRNPGRVWTLERTDHSTLSTCGGRVRLAFEFFLVDTMDRSYQTAMLSARSRCGVS